ncbi:hypothetical protein [Magnetospira sp. QH-2]|uniref:hypothetical protein n=1 Tax=Magnetospira sp. (strain QH-2) TaxID=1288970 RepID=UPI0003E813BB|nr:hypothetical protein [Magnetospira sp. QH-2]CCQ73376.1 Protein of unknown function [Magnetospira sp. QH-2]
MTFAWLIDPVPAHAGYDGLERVTFIWGHGLGCRKADVELPLFKTLDPNAVELGTSTGKRFPNLRMQAREGGVVVHAHFGKMKWDAFTDLVAKYVTAAGE